MSHGNDIRAIHTRNDLTADEKRIKSYEVKGNAYLGIAHHVINEPWQDGDLTINVTSLNVDGTHRVIVECEAWRDGTKLSLDLPFIYVNPPLIHNGEESPLTTLKQIVLDTINRVD